MLNLDLLLTAVGVVLTAIGVGVLLVGKSRATADGDRRNVFEAFGIKLDVANPSVLLIMFGVVLMLTPRVLPLDKGGEVLATVMPTPPEAEPAPAPDVLAKPAPATVAAAHPSAPPEAEAEPAEVAAPAAPSRPPSDVAQQEAQSIAAEQARALAKLQREREAIAREQAALAEQKARLAALSTPAEPPPAAVVLPAVPAAGSPREASQEKALPRLTILTEAIDYEGESADSLRDKLQGELRVAVSDVLAGALRVDGGDVAFRDLLRAGDLAQLCKRTQAEHLLLADLTPVDVVSFSVESANWPNMRYAAVECASGRSHRSGWMRMEPTVGDQYPLQKSVARSAREFVQKNRHLLQ